MTREEKIQRFVQLFESDRLGALSPESLKYDFNIANCKVFTFPGKKYTKVDCNGSGVYMVDNTTEEIFGIKAYGVPHKGQRFGTLDTITDYHWGGYRARPMVRESIIMQSVEEVLKDRNLYLGKDRKVHGGKYGPEKEPEPPKPEKIFTGDRYAELLEDLSQAAKMSFESALFVDDGGTCNLDGVFLRLPQFNEEKTLEVIQKAGLSGFKLKHNLYGTGFLVSPPSVGQANKREVAADTLYDTLQAKNYDVSHWQQMD